MMQFLRHLLKLLEYYAGQIRYYGFSFVFKLFYTDVKIAYLQDVIYHKNKFEKQSEDEFSLYARRHDLIKSYLISKSKSDEKISLEKKKDNLTDPIWVCWWQGEDCMPELCKMCYESILKHSGHHPVILITKENVRDYIELPDFVLSKLNSGNFGFANFADILRVCLIAEYGGLWLDCTIYLTDNIDEKYFKREFSSFSFGEGRNNVFVSRFRWSTFFLGTHCGSDFFKDLEQMLLYYAKREKFFIDYLVIDYFIDILMERESYVSYLSYCDVNSELYSLQPLLNRKYDEELWSSLTNKACVFKLSYKENVCDDKGTFYSYMKNLANGLS
jgi:hypothetical protein